MIDEYQQELTKNYKKLHMSVGSYNAEATKDIAFEVRLLLVRMATLEALLTRIEAKE